LPKSTAICPFNQMPYLYLISVFLISYLIGSLPTAFFVTKKHSGQDVRTIGTGNVGAMNVVRATNKPHLFVLVFLIDALKGAIPVWIVKNYISWPEIEILNTSFSIWIITACAFGVVLGHCYSIYFKIKENRFYGGKAISSLIGILGVLDFSNLLLPWAGICLVFILATGYLFLGQLMGTIFLPFIGFLFTRQYFWLCFLIAIPVFIKQWPRFIPMLKGEEPRWYWKLPKKKG